MSNPNSNGAPPPITYSADEAALATLADLYMPLKIDGIHDEEGFELVHKARMTVRQHRVDIEHRRKELKQVSLEYGRRVDSEAKRLKAIIGPVEEHLQEEEAKVERERERLRKEEERKAKEKLDLRVASLARFGAQVAPSELEAMTDGDFEALMVAAMEAHDLERERLAEEKKREEALAAAKKAEDEERERAQRAEREALERQLAAEREELARLREEREKQAEELERLRRVEVERDAAEEFARSNKSGMALFEHERKTGVFGSAMAGFPEEEKEPEVAVFDCTLPRTTDLQEQIEELIADGAELCLRRPEAEIVEATHTWGEGDAMEQVHGEAKTIEQALLQVLEQKDARLEELADQLRKEQAGATQEERADAMLEARKEGE